VCRFLTIEVKQFSDQAIPRRSRRVEPQEKDLAEFRGEYDSIYAAVALIPYGDKEKARPRDICAPEHHFLRVIQRDGNLFFWPEREAV
jgi:hypothetical protein